MCDHAVRGNTLEEKLNDLKMLSLTDEGVFDSLDNKGHILKPWTWFAGKPQVAPESANAPPTAPPADDTRISDLEATISSQKEIIKDLERQLSASNNRTSEQSQQLREANTKIRDLTFQLADDSKVHLQQRKEIQQLTEELRKHGVSLLDEEAPKEEFKKFINVIVLSPDHSYALNMKTDEPISQGVRVSQDPWTSRSDSHHYLNNQDTAPLKAYIFGKKLRSHETVQDLLITFNVSTESSEVLNSSWQKISPTAPIQTIIIRDKR